MKLLLIDNYDSFTNNLVYLAKSIAGTSVVIKKNNEISFEDTFEYDGIIISPGPGTVENPNDFGVCTEVIKDSLLPILGVCLGHQGIAYFSGAKIKQVNTIHGQVTSIYHQGEDLFLNVPSPFKAVRYNSLAIEDCSSTFPKHLLITAQSEDKQIMGIQHLLKPQWGVQFHPESLLSEFGKEILENFLRLINLRHQGKIGQKICQDSKGDSSQNYFFNNQESKLNSEITYKNLNDTINLSYQSADHNADKKEADKALDKTSDKETTTERYLYKLNLEVSKLPSYLEPELCFEVFHKELGFNFWLDSSTPNQNGNSRDLLLNNTSQQFSYFGNCTRLLCKQVNYTKQISSNDDIDYTLQNIPYQNITCCSPMKSQKDLQGADCNSQTTPSHITNYQIKTIITIDGNVIELPEDIFSYFEKVSFEITEIDLSRLKTSSKKSSADFSGVSATSISNSSSFFEELLLSKIFIGGFLGYFSYEAKNLLGYERTPSIKEISPTPLNTKNTPLAEFYFIDELVIFSHQSREIFLVKVNFLEDSEESLKDSKLKILPKNISAMETYENNAQKALNLSNKIANKIAKNKVSIPAFKNSAATKHIYNQATKGTLKDIKLLKDFKFLDEQKAYQDKIHSSIDYIKKGEAYQLCLTNRLIGPKLEDPLNVYLTLRQNNPSSFSALFLLEDRALLSTSPEELLAVIPSNQPNTLPSPLDVSTNSLNELSVKLHHQTFANSALSTNYSRNNLIARVRPIKGTLTKTQDSKWLINNQKELAENLMIVDLVRHELTSLTFSENLQRRNNQGKNTTNRDLFSKHPYHQNVQVPKLFALETYQDLHHLVSEVTVTLGENTSSLDCIRAVFPAGSMTGAPKKRAIELLNTLESSPRGIYSGTLGYFSLNNTAHFNVLIRTLIIENNYTYLGTGGGITILSDPEKEFEEIKLKCQFFTKLGR